MADGFFSNIWNNALSGYASNLAKLTPLGMTTNMAATPATSFVNWLKANPGTERITGYVPTTANPNPQGLSTAATDAAYIKGLGDAVKAREIDPTIASVGSAMYAEDNAEGNPNAGIMLEGLQRNKDESVWQKLDQLSALQDEGTQRAKDEAAWQAMGVPKKTKASTKLGSSRTSSMPKSGTTASTQASGQLINNFSNNNNNSKNTGINWPMLLMALSALGGAYYLGRR